MVWTPDSMDERTEIALHDAARGIIAAIGQERARAMLDKLLLARKDVLLATAEPDNPALIRLKELLNQQERGFE
jgi:hypothetical protein